MHDRTKPRARHDGVRIEGTATDPVAVDEATGEAFLLRPEWLATWERCDGELTVQAIAADLRADGIVGDVWASLDALADLGLLVTRVAPPAGTARVNRRNLLRASVVGGAVLAAAGATPAAAAGIGQELGDKGRERAEQLQKAAQERRAKAQGGESQQEQEQQQKKAAEAKQKQEQQQKGSTEEQQKQEQQQKKAAEAKQKQEQQQKGSTEEQQKQEQRQKSAQQERDLKAEQAAKG